MVKGQRRGWSSGAVCFPGYLSAHMEGAVSMVDEVGPQQGVASCPASQVFGTWGEGGLAFFWGGG